MQGQRSTLDFFADTFGLDHGASSSNAGMSQQLFWNDVLNPVEVGYQECPPPLGGGSADVNVIGHEGRSLSGWNLGEPSSSERTRGHMIHNEAKTEHLWSRNHAGSGPSLEERRHEAANTMSLGSVHLNLNNNLLGNGSLFSQASSSDEIPQNLNLNAGYTSNSGSGGFMEPSSLHSAGSSDHFGMASGSGGYLVDEGDARPGCSLDGRRLSCKRKTLEGGVSGQSSSLRGNSSCYQQAENSLWHSFPPRFDAASSSAISTPAINPLTLNLPEPMNPQPVVGIRGADPALSLAGNAETSHRNFRLRTNPANQQDLAPPNLPPTGYPARHSLGWSPNQLSSRAILFSQSLDLRPPAANVSLESRSQATHDHSLPQNVHPFSFNGAPNVRSGSSSSSTLIPAERPNALREGVHLGMPRNISEHSMFVAASEMRNLAQEPTSWNLANGSSTTPGNSTSNPRVGSSSVIHPSPSSAWAPHPNPTSQYSRRLSEVVRRSLFPSAGSESGAPSSTFPPLRSGPSASSPEGAPSSVAGQQGNPQPYPRSAFLMDRQGDGVPLSFRSLAAATEGRSRLLSEVRFRHIRNVLDMVRSDGLRFERKIDDNATSSKDCGSAGSTALQVPNAIDEFFRVTSVPRCANAFVDQEDPNARFIPKCNSNVSSSPLIVPKQIIRFGLESGAYASSPIDFKVLQSPLTEGNAWWGFMLHDTDMRCLLKEVGVFDAIRAAGKLTINKDMDGVIPFVSRWCWSTNTFVTRWGEFTISLEAVSALYNLPILGNIPDHYTDDTNRMIMKLRADIVFFHVPNTARKNNYINWIESWYVAGQSPSNDSPKSTICVSSFLTLWLFRDVFEDDPANHLKPSVVPLSVLMAHRICFPIGSLFLGSQYTHLGALARNMTVSWPSRIPSFINTSFIQVSMWEYYPRYSPKVGPCLPNTDVVEYARIVQWGDKKDKKLSKLVNLLDSEENIVFRPWVKILSARIVQLKTFGETPGISLCSWSGDLSNEQAVFFCSSIPGYILGLYRVELVKKQYNIDRAARVMGFDQGVPVDRLPAPYVKVLKASLDSSAIPGVDIPLYLLIDQQG